MTETDGKVAPDFLFSRIKNVHFGGGDYIRVDCTVTVAGGTLNVAMFKFNSVDLNHAPSFPALLAGSAPPGFQTMTRDQASKTNISKANLSNVLRLTDGSSLKGFGINYPASESIDSSYWNTVGYFAMPLSAFTIFFAAITGPSTLTTISVSTFKKNGVSASQKLDFNGSPVPVHGVTITGNTHISSEFFPEFMVDPITRLVTAKPGPAASITSQF